MGLDRERLARRVDGREQAKAIGGLVSLDHPDKVAAFLDELRTMFEPEAVLAEAVDDQRKLSELAAVRLPRGIHAGERLDDVPRDYLDWWIRDGEEWAEKIGGYLAATKHLDGGLIDVDS
jgi:uncharacterized protein (DUF3820 family)